MKRLVQVWMVAVALVIGAQAAQAAPIAEFSWLEDELDPFLVTFRLTNVSGGEINSIEALVTYFGDTSTSYDADMAGTTIFDPDPNDPFDGGQSINLATFALNTVQFVYLTFRHVGADQIVRAFSEKYDAAYLVGSSGSPVYLSLDPAVVIDSEQGTVQVPEPLSLSLLGLGVAAAAIARRRH